MTEITEDSKGPAFDMATAGGGRVSLDGLKGRTVVLYFYPKADTPACTTEGQDFSALIGDFDESGALVIGVSRDPVKKLDRFKAKYDLKVILASD
ncbi:MAG: peroxiredoxin, partial [Brevundimonas sp.]|nr:peroxiredoxin [Brevundimonas sp.]